MHQVGVAVLSVLLCPLLSTLFPGPPQVPALSLGAGDVGKLAGMELLVLGTTPLAALRNPDQL